MGSLRGRRAKTVFVIVVWSEGVMKRRWVWWRGLRENEEKKEKRRGGRGVGMRERENLKKKMRENKRRKARKGKCVRGKVKRVLLNKLFFLLQSCYSGLLKIAVHCS